MLNNSMCKFICITHSTTATRSNNQIANLDEVYEMTAFWTTSSTYNQITVERSFSMFHTTDLEKWMGYILCTLMIKRDFLSQIRILRC